MLRPGDILQADYRLRVSSGNVQVLCNQAQ